MTARRKGGKKASRPASVEEVVKRTMDGLKDVPHIGGLMLLSLAQSALANLQHYIEKDKAGIDWKNPFVELQYEVRLIESEDAPDVVADEAEIQEAVLESLPQGLEVGTMYALTRGVEVHLVEPFFEAGRRCNCHIMPPPEVDAEIKALPEDQRDDKLAELAEGFKLGLGNVSGAFDTPAGPQQFAADIFFVIRPLTVDTIQGRAYYPIMVGLAFSEGDPAAWSDEDKAEFWRSVHKSFKVLSDEWLKETDAEGLALPKTRKPDRVVPALQEDFAVAGGYVRPIYGLSRLERDLPKMQAFLAPQTPLNWAVGLALFSLTDPDRVRSGDFQEAKIGRLVDRVYCLTEEGAPRRGDQRDDILAEVVKLHTTQNFYYEVEAIKVGRAWKTQATIGSRIAIPEIQLVFIDTKTGKRTIPSDAAVRALRVPLEVRGRRVMKPDGKDIPALPKGRWKLDAVRWRWVQSFNDDLLRTPALIEDGKRKGLPKKTVGGKVIRKGYLIRVAKNIFTALKILRGEGGRSLYACRLLVMLTHNLNKTEDGIAADRVFRMLGIADDFTKKTHRKPEDLVAEAIFRLKQRDIGALLPGSDEYPRTDPNPDRRKGPYYRLVRSSEYTPRAGIASSKEEAEAIEAEYSEVKEPPAAAPPPVPESTQKTLPGLDLPPAPPVPSGDDIRAAREAAGMNLRRFAESIGGGSFNTWSRYERGEKVRVGKIAPDTWQRVADFVAQHKPKDDQAANLRDDPDGGKAGS